MNKVQVVKATASEILDSRGNPTLEVGVYLSDGSVGFAGVPSGASTGTWEAHELRDRDHRYGGLGVTHAVYNVNKLISPAITGISATDQSEIDRTLLALDGTENKEKLGANAMLGTSLAAARAAAVSLGVPLYRYIGGRTARRLPIPMMNVLNGGAHASNNLDIQEFMIVPVGADDYHTALRMGSEIYHTLGKLLRADGHACGVGDEGGFAPDLPDDRAALTYLTRAVTESGYSTEDVRFSLDVAASEWVDGDTYHLPKAGKTVTADTLIEYYRALSEEFPILSIEDGLGEDDADGWHKLTSALGDRVTLVGDDLFVTNPRRLTRGIATGIANAVLVKPNQIGTLGETLEVIDIARRAGYDTILSHRSGETDDTTIADIAVGCGAMYIKAGAPCRGERVAKYNRLLHIEASLGDSAIYAR